MRENERRTVGAGPMASTRGRDGAVAATVWAAPDPAGGAAGGPETGPAPYQPSPRTRAQQGWSDVAPHYARLAAALTDQIAPRLVAAAGVAAERRVLDLCSGPGAATAAAQARGADALGVDFSPAMVALARTRHPKAVFRIGDALALHVRAGLYDAVMCNFGLPLLEAPEQALREAFRALADGGRLVWTAWAEPADNPFFAAAAGALIKDEPAFFRLGDPPSGEAATRAAGFDEIVIERVDVEIDIDAADALDLMRGLEPAIDRAAARAPDGGEALGAALARALSAFDRNGRLRARAAAHLISARKPVAALAAAAERVAPSEATPPQITAPDIAAAAVAPLQAAPAEAAPDVIAAGEAAPEVAPPEEAAAPGEAPGDAPLAAYAPQTPPPGAAAEPTPDPALVDAPTRRSAVWRDAAEPGADMPPARFIAPPPTETARAPEPVTDIPAAPMDRTTASPVGADAPPPAEEATDPAAGNPASVLDPSVLDPAVLEPAALDPGSVDPGVLDPPVLDPPVLDPVSETAEPSTPAAAQEPSAPGDPAAPGEVPRAETAREGAQDRDKDPTDRRDDRRRRPGSGFGVVRRLLGGRRG